MNQKPSKLTSFLRPTALDMPGAPDAGCPWWPHGGALGIDPHLDEIRVGLGESTHFHRNSDNIYVALDGTAGIGVAGDRLEATGEVPALYLLMSASRNSDKDLSMRPFRNLASPNLI